MAFYTRRTNFSAMLVTIAILAMATMSPWSNCVDGVKKASVIFPPILLACLTPLSPSSTLRWEKELSNGKTLKNVSNFCTEAGIICDESIEAPSVILHQLSRYKLEKAKEVSLQHAHLFFPENKLSLGSLIKLPIKEPYLPTRAFLPPLLQPHLFNPLTSLFPHMLLPFGFHVGTPLAKSMQETLQTCNAPPLENETKACVATFESMLDFATSIIGSPDVAILTGKHLPPQQIVRIMELEEMTWGGRRAAIACHNAMFPFQVFYCHHIKGTKVFKVSLQTTLNRVQNISAIASCHPLEASSYLQRLTQIKLQHGERLCHWNDGDNIIWIPRSKMVLSPSSSFGKLRELSQIN